MPIWARPRAAFRSLNGPAKPCCRCRCFPRSPRSRSIAFPTHFYAVLDRRSVMSKPLRLGLIGCGHWGKNYAAAIAGMEDVVLAWCADTSEAARERARGLNPGVHLTADLNELLADPDCDGVIVAAPPQQHAAIARAAIAARKPVLVEKPLATTVAAARDLAAAARTAGTVAVSGHVYLFHPVVVEIVERIRSGKTGRLRFMSASRAFTRLASSDD